MRVCHAKTGKHGNEAIGGKSEIRDRPFMGGGGGVAPKRNVFLGKHFADPIIKMSKNHFTHPQISIKK